MYSYFSNWAMHVNSKNSKLKKTQYIYYKYYYVFHLCIINLCCYIHVNLGTSYEDLN
jgi:hypothetical protein